MEVTGPDGFRFAQLLTCRDLSTCAVGQAKYVLITAPDGGILNDPVMLRLDENTFWFALADSDVLPVRKGAGRVRRDGRPALGGRGVPAPDPGAEVEGRRARPVRRRCPRPPLLPLPPSRAGRHPAHPHPHGLDLGGRIRDLSPRHLARNGSLGTDHGGGGPVRDAPDRAGRHPADRGRHLQLGRRHDLREQPVRAGPGPARRSGQRRRIRRPGGAREDPRRRGEAEDRRDRDRGRPAGDERDDVAGLDKRCELEG